MHKKQFSRMIQSQNSLKSYLVSKRTEKKSSENKILVPTLRGNISSSENLQRIVIANPIMWLATFLGNVSRLISPWLKRSLIRGPSWWFKKSQRKSCGNIHQLYRILGVFTQNWIYQCIEYLWKTSMWSCL